MMGLVEVNLVVMVVVLSEGDKKEIKKALSFLFVERLTKKMDTTVNLDPCMHGRWMGGGGPLPQHHKEKGSFLDIIVPLCSSRPSQAKDAHNFQNERCRVDKFSFFGDTSSCLARERERRRVDMHIANKQHCCMQQIVSDFKCLNTFYPISRLVTTKMCKGLGVEKTKFSRLATFCLYLFSCHVVFSVLRNGLSWWAKSPLSLTLSLSLCFLGESAEALLLLLVHSITLLPFCWLSFVSIVCVCASIACPSVKEFRKNFLEHPKETQKHLELVYLSVCHWNCISHGSLSLYDITFSSWFSLFLSRNAC